MRFLWGIKLCKTFFFFLQQRSHLQAKKLGEDGVGECHLIWMQASLNQKNSCKGGTKLSGLFLQQIWRHTPSRKRRYDPENGMNEKCAGMLRGKI